ncbi:unnamed protein product [Nezara viridula]|uniref:Uncharacterized protein n=1 Tax=Nezara viridula TaxID=85310 RepID=A0A9P0H673_NEZVI|nr:unnamed protein product [Nezara viridula]
MFAEAKPFTLRPILTSNIAGDHRLRRIINESLVRLDVLYRSLTKSRGGSGFLPAIFQIGPTHRRYKKLTRLSPPDPFNYDHSEEGLYKLLRPSSRHYSQNLRMNRAFAAGGQNSALAHKAKSTQQWLRRKEQSRVHFSLGLALRKS